MLEFLSGRGESKIMDTLPTVIGPAPSEMTVAEFKTKLLGERERTRRGLEWFRKAKFKPKTKAKQSALSINKMMKDAGLNKAQLLKGFELLKQMKKDKPKP